MKKTIVHVVQHLSPGGIEMLVLELMRISAPEEDIHVISIEGNKNKSLQNWAKLQPFEKKLHFIDKRPGLSITAFLKVLNILRRLKPQAVHTHHIGPLVYGGLISKILGVPSIVHTEHDAWHLNNRHNQKLDSYLYKLVNPIVVADAQLVARQIEEKIKDAHPRVILNGIDLEKFTPGSLRSSRNALAIPVAAKVVGCSARLVHEKSIHTLIHAFMHLPKSIHLAIAGNGPLYPELLALTRELKINERVHFLGHVDDMTQFYRSLDVFCLPSKREGMPLAPLEAQACGVPAIVTRVGGAFEVVCPVTGMLVEPEQPQALCLSILAALETKLLRSPRQFVVENANIRTTSASYSELYT